MSTEEKPVVKPISRNLREAITDGLLKANVEVRSAIVATRTQEEIEKRVKATTVVLEKYEALENELRKIRPSFAGYTEAGAPVGDPIYSKDQVEQLKRTNEQLAKLNTALERALNDNNFDKVFEIANK